MKIIITGVVRHDGADLEIGAPVELPDRQAQDLIDVGAAEPVTKKSKVDKDEQGEK